MLFKQRKTPDQLRLEKIELMYQKFLNNLVNRLLFQFHLDPSTAEDIIQLTFERILKYGYDFGEFDEKQALKYVHAVMANIAYDYIEKSKKISLVHYENIDDILNHAVIPLIEDSPELLYTERYLINYAMKKLPPKYSTLISLHYKFGYTAKEIAQLLGSTENSVHQRLHYIRNKLRAILVKEDYYDEK